MTDPKLAFLLKPTRQISPSTHKHTFSSPIELDRDLFIHILVQVQYVFLLGFFTTLRTASSIPSRSAVGVAATSSTTPAAEVTSLGHWVACGWVRRTGIRKKKREKQNRSGEVWKCGSREEKSLDWQFGWFGPYPYRCLPAVRFRLRGPGTGGGVWIAGCGLRWC